MCATTRQERHGQRHEAAAVRKQRAGSIVPGFFYSVLDPASEMVLPKCMVCLHSPVKPLWKHHPRRAQRCASQVTPNPVQMTSLTLVFLVKLLRLQSLAWYTGEVRMGFWFALIWKGLSLWRMMAFIDLFIHSYSLFGLKMCTCIHMCGVHARMHAWVCVYQGNILVTVMCFLYIWEVLTMCLCGGPCTYVLWSSCGGQRTTWGAGAPFPPHRFQSFNSNR